MKFFNNEKNLLEYFRGVDSEEVMLIPNVKETSMIFQSVKCPKNWEKWTDSSHKGALPPDYFCNEFKLMMEIMRVDDKSRQNEKGRIVNPTIERESRIELEIRKKINISANSHVLVVGANTDLPTYDNHNYIFYRKNFKRVLDKHKEKIQNYKKNHPSFKLIFFVMDESTGYFEDRTSLAAERGFVGGEMFIGTPHFHFLDDAFVGQFLNCEIDYLIWWTPWKLVDTTDGIIPFPRAVVIDIKKFFQDKKNYQKVLKYDERHMFSSEM
ncbi:MAG: hypothetical protein FWE22_02625 [Firmicutes bacterium]|nr:hypothetical protein [Bacillota bacterium]